MNIILLLVGLGLIVLGADWLVAKHRDQLALGNILGSNVFNILLILGCSSVITPLSFGGMNLVDASALIVSCLMLLAFAAYYYYLFVKL